MATSAEISAPQGIATDSVGNVFIGDYGNARIRRVSPDGTITTAAGSGEVGYSGDGGSALSARLNAVYSAAVDSAGNQYVADGNNRRVHKVSIDGTITTVAGSGDGGFAGDGGPALTAALGSVTGVAVDATGNLYIAAPFYARVRKVSPDGTITSVAGNGVPGYSGDGGLATDASLNNPSGPAVDTAGNLYIADSSNARIPKVTPDGMITTVAGGSGIGFSGDGGQATSAGLAFPSAVAVDPFGTLYIADTDNHRIRKVDSIIASSGVN